MASMRVWAASALGLVMFHFYIRAYGDGNDSYSLDMPHSSPSSVTTERTSDKTDGVITTKLRLTTSPLVHHSNKTTAGTSTGTYENITEMETTLAPPTAKLTTTSLTPSPKKPTKAPAEMKWDDKWNEDLKYDYSSLRHVGLTIAAVLFLLGIMVITCGKIRCRHLHKGRSYEETRM